MSREFELRVVEVAVPHTPESLYYEDMERRAWEEHLRSLDHETRSLLDEVEVEVLRMTLFGGGENMPKKWREELDAELAGKDKAEQKKALMEAAKELNEAAKANGHDPQELVQAFGRKVG